MGQKSLVFKVRSEESTKTLVPVFFLETHNLSKSDILEFDLAPYHPILSSHIEYWSRKIWLI